MEAETLSTVEVRLSGSGRDNRLARADVEAFYRDLGAAEADQNVAVIVVRGGEEHFSEGWSAEFLATIPTGIRRRVITTLQRELVPAVWHSKKLVVAEVRGNAFGFGCELALLADITIADSRAALGHPEFRDGLVTPSAWPWLAGAKSAKYYLSTGRSIEGVALANSGLVNHVVDVDGGQRTEAMVSDLLGMPPGTAAANKQRIGWAWRDISRVLYDDTFYAVDDQWLIDSREYDYSFYRKVKDEGFAAAIDARDDRFSQ